MADDLIDRMTSLESGRLPGTTPTFEPRTSLQSAWNPKTGLFQSEDVERLLEEPSVVSQQEFTKPGIVHDPKQHALDFGRSDDDLER